VKRLAFMALLGGATADLPLIAHAQQAAHFRLWHKADVAPGVSDIRTRVKSRHP
jgi:hypothetical protein